MRDEPRVEVVTPRPLAVVHESAIPAADVPQRIRDLLGEVWTTLRATGPATGHNVAIYDRAWREGGRLVFDARFGVEAFGPFSATARVVAAATPAGRVAVATHWGPYSELGVTYGALHAWCAATHLALAGPSWEVYGDWSDDPAQLRTDLFLLLA